MFKYKVRYWDETESKTLNETGLVAAKSWGKAVERLREYYGPQNIYSITIEEWDDIISAEEVLNGLTEE